MVRVLEAAPRDSASRPSRDTGEHLNLILDDGEATALMHMAARELARAEVPYRMAPAFMRAYVTVLPKASGMPRGIATGRSCGRTVASFLVSIVGERRGVIILPLCHCYPDKHGMF